MQQMCGVATLARRFTFAEFSIKIHAARSERQKEEQEQMASVECRTGKAHTKAWEDADSVWGR